MSAVMLGLWGKEEQVMGRASSSYNTSVWGSGREQEKGLRWHSGQGEAAAGASGARL